MPLKKQQSHLQVLIWVSNLGLSRALYGSSEEIHGYQAINMINVSETTFSKAPHVYNMPQVGGYGLQEKQL